MAIAPACKPEESQVTVGAAHWGALLSTWHLTILPAVGNQVLLLLIGFVLTSVLGGTLGFLFQTRSWSHQHDAQRRDEERAQAIKVFEEVSSLLDRRLYRMRLVYWAAKRRARGGADSDALDKALTDYREVLGNWNDNLNRTMALVQTYFGGAARRQLEDELYEGYSEIGRALDQLVRDVSGSSDGDVQVPPIGRRLTGLGHKVGRFNLRLLTLLQNDQLGSKAPRAEPSRQAVASLLEFGSQGSAVARLQRALRRAGRFAGRVDGGFGERTEAAVRSAQRSAGLAVDAIVGPDTWAALPSGSSMPMLAEGSQGEVVASLQAVLARQATSRWEASPGGVDGVFDATTTRSVQAFQRWNRLSADGIVGDDTWGASIDADGQTLEMAVGLKYINETAALVEPSR